MIQKGDSYRYSEDKVDLLIEKMNWLARHGWDCDWEFDYSNGRKEMILTVIGRLPGVVDEEDDLK